MRMIGSTMVRAVAGLLALAMTATAGLAASEFEGKWKVADSSGKDYEITLAADGSAAGTQQEGQKGTWKEDGSAVVISWDTGWTTVISKEGGKYKKTAFKKGEPVTGTPTNSSPAEKVK
jgi:hypothetical protein